ncbi:MAG TPA: type 4a pilus biogenesis protein PilO [Bryobacteraceae bacterium]|nr:type 4a pilus biogenesis protein PilO [Bryobacteraceae bacterium]
MAKNSKDKASAAGVQLRVQWRDPRFMVRAALGILLAANVAAAALVLFPPGGSAEDLDREMASLESQVMQGKAKLARVRAHASAVESGRNEGDQFMDQYFLDRRTAYSTLVSELNQAAIASKIKPREHAFSTEPIDGSDTLSMMTITANFDGAYKDVLNFVHAIDQSPRLLIIESLNAAPQQGSNILTVSMKLDTFVREDQGE